MHLAIYRTLFFFFFSLFRNIFDSGIDPFTPLFACRGTILLTRCKRINPNSHRRVFSFDVASTLLRLILAESSKVDSVIGNAWSLSRRRELTNRRYPLFVTAIRRYLAKAFVFRSKEHAILQLSVPHAVISVPHLSYLPFRFLTCSHAFIPNTSVFLAKYVCFLDYTLLLLF